MATVRRTSLLFLAGTIMLIAVCLPARSAEITTPEKFLGFKVGADYKLATYEQAIGYLELLASQSPRIKVLDMGPTSMGRRQKYAVISSEEAMKDLDRFKGITKKLSLARGTAAAEAHKLAEEGKAVVYIDGGMHASEVVGSDQQIQLAYDLVTGEDRQTKLIRDLTGQSVLILYFLEQV
ncbi:MAG: M14 family zinc carboxypeptidase [Acidobacteriota bacterium]